MVESDKGRFATAIGAMLVMFGQEASPPRLLGYWMGLQGLTIEQVETAVGNAMQTAMKLPVPAELRQGISGGSAGDRAVSAWGDVQDAASTSYMVDLDFDDWTINAVIRNLGGRWNFFDRLNGGAESEKWLRIEFLRCYAVYAESPPSDEATTPLIGMATHGVECGRLHRPRMVRIGADQKRLEALPPRPVQRITGQNVTNAAMVEFQKVQ